MHNATIYYARLTDVGRASAIKKRIESSQSLIG